MRVCACVSSLATPCASQRRRGLIRRSRPIGVVMTAPTLHPALIIIAPSSVTVAPSIVTWALNRTPLARDDAAAGRTFMARSRSLRWTAPTCGRSCRSRTRTRSTRRTQTGLWSPKRSSLPAGAVRLWASRASADCALDGTQGVRNPRGQSGFCARACVCACACVRTCVRACVRMCVRAR